MEVLSPNYCGTHCICDWRAGRPIRRCMDFVSIFAALVVGLILEPMPPAFIGMIAITLAVLFRVGMPVVEKARKIVPTTAGQAINWGLSGFSNAIVWLIFAAFMIGIGYQNSGLGRRIALFLVQKLGKSSLGLGYAIAITDLILAPFIPSNAARRVLSTLSFPVFARCLTAIRIKTRAVSAPIYVGSAWQRLVCPVPYSSPARRQTHWRLNSLPNPALLPLTGQAGS